MLKLKLQYFGHLMGWTDSLEKTLMRGKIESGRRRGQQRMRCWMASPTWWTWVWASSRSGKWTGKPGMLPSWGCKDSDVTDQLNWTRDSRPGRKGQEQPPGKVLFSHQLLSFSHSVVSDFLQPPFCNFPVFHYLPQFAQTHVHWVNDATQTSHSLSSPSSCPQSFPESWSFPMSQLFASGG